ncbi:hypothetical protein BO78DRAFT_300697 [Aspergillus sclerotiicarbonarius CBS 121057]|uniref:Integral membrane protein n=1 Tax=Aspergillus sclerotiicarbonarius (strain CBS 121057 / IBT 28362) TaxID=1448318 RepID=A0A319EQZ1_ASPSB|nr:hypothetical protein BO78DRAFT_300697 [Aspergillus sclerotiicarbonarius CBS 121057]
MDGFDITHAPPAYRSIEPIVNIFVLGMGLGWVINYIGMVYISFKEQTYAMAILPLCCNIAWEIVFGVIHHQNRLESTVIQTGMVLNLAIMYSAIKCSPNEWAHAPLVQRNLPGIFFLGVAGFFTGHLALVAELGPGLAYSYGALVCQLLLSAGGLCQLLCRGRRRGASYLLWLSRFLGSCCSVGFAYLRWRYWPEAFAWLNSPIMLWALGVFVLLDGSYGVCYWYVVRYEKTVASAREQMVKSR